MGKERERAHEENGGENTKDDRERETTRKKTHTHTHKRKHGRYQLPRRDEARRDGRYDARNTNGASDDVEDGPCSMTQRVERVYDTIRYAMRGTWAFTFEWGVDVKFTSHLKQQGEMSSQTGRRMRCVILRKEGR
ncbi:hypothetical protein DID88_007342 [Monilinia fructigena]|uniref:Uncharacterized protein n=1 Tax=Monilinia fructigena TaxID=38457 RepID=A0A395JD07_9HELO|nr:hypothetical protein DID88_007342 [Monilinia fructigena]